MLVCFAAQRARSPAALVFAAMLCAGLIAQASRADAAARNARSAYTITSTGPSSVQGGRLVARPGAQGPRARNTIRTIPLWSAGVPRRP